MPERQLAGGVFSMPLVVDQRCEVKALIGELTDKHLVTVLSRHGINKLKTQTRSRVKAQIEVYFSTAVLKFSRSIKHIKK